MSSGLVIDWVKKSRKIGSPVCYSLKKVNHSLTLDSIVHGDSSYLFKFFFFFKKSKERKNNTEKKILYLLLFLFN